MKRSRLLAGAALLATTAVIVTAVAAFAVAQFITRGAAVSHVYIATSDFNSTMSSTTYTTLPGMVISLSVPATGSPQVLDIRFSAETACYGGGTTSNWCTVQILVDGAPAQPVDACSGTRDYAIDSTDTGNTTAGNWAGHAMERFAVVRPGRHLIQVQGAVTDFGATGAQVFWTGERILVIDQAKVLGTSGTNTCGATRSVPQGS